MKKISRAVCFVAMAAAVSLAHAAPTDTIPPQAPPPVQQYPGNLAMQQLIDHWTGRLVTNDLFQTADQVKDQIDKQKFVHQVFELFLPVPTGEGVPQTLFYNPVTQQLRVGLGGDHKIKAVAFVEPNVHPAVYAYPLYFLAGHKEYSTFNGRTQSGLSSELSDVIQDVEQFALVNLPYANTASRPFMATIPLSPVRAQSIIKHAMWHMTVETELVPSQKKFIPEDMALLTANTAFPTRYRSESHIVTVALKHADLIDTGDNEIVLSIDQNAINRFEHLQAAISQTGRPATPDNIFPH
jgi:hypothetical protein